MTAITVVFTAQWNRVDGGVGRGVGINYIVKEVIVFFFFLFYMSKSQPEQYVMNILCIISYCGLNSIKPNYGNLLNQFEKSKRLEKSKFLNVKNDP